MVAPHRSEPLSVEVGERRAFAPQTLHARIRRTIDVMGGRIAMESGETVMTYAELGAAADAGRAELAAAGVAPGARVAIVGDPGPLQIAAVLAVLEHGCAFVPISNKEGPERMLYMLRDSSAAAVVADPRYAARVEPAGRPVISVDTIRARATPPPSAPVDPESEAYVIYTSGTTGRPKGVRVAHRSIAHFGDAIGRLYRASPSDRVLGYYSLSVDTSLEEICLALFNGARLVIASEVERHAPRRLQSMMAERGLTMAILPLKVAAEMDAAALPALRLVVFGGEPVHAEAVNRWQHGGREVWNGYGPTEATVAVTQMACRGHFDHPPPIGRPMENHTIVILDEAEAAPVESGSIGEIAVGGPGVALGYVNRPDLTEERFIPNPLDHDGLAPVLYRTGDLGRWSTAGDLIYCGRRDGQVQVGGFRVEIAEVEDALLSHPRVSFAAVTTREARGTRELVAFVRTRDREPTLDGYWAHMRTRLPHHMIPSDLRVIDDIPLSRSGKVDRERLRELAAASELKQRAST